MDKLNLYLVSALSAIILASCGFFKSKKTTNEQTSADASEHTMDQEDMTTPTISYHSTVGMKLTKSEESISGSTNKRVLIKINLTGLAKTDSISKIKEQFSMGYCIGSAGEEKSCSYTNLDQIDFSDQQNAEIYLPDAAFNKDSDKVVFVKARYCDQGVCKELYLTYGVSDSFVVADSANQKSDMDIDMNQSGPEFGSEK